MNVREHIQNELETYQKKVVAMSALLQALPQDLGELEADGILVYGGWLNLRDETHKGLGAALATIADQPCRFDTWIPSVRTATFRDVGPFYRVDLTRPNPKCRKYKVLKTAEVVTMEFCGELPPGYDVLAVLEEESDGA